MQDIRQYLKQLADREGLSLKGLSDLLGYKSRTSLDRILKDSAKPESIRKLEQLLNRRFELTQDERNALHAAVRVSIYGEEKCRAMQYMWHFVQGAQEQPESLHATLADGTAVDLYERYAHAKQVKISLVNGQYMPGLFALLGRLLQQGNTQVEHFLYVDRNSARTVCSVCALMPVFYEPNYSVYVRRESQKDESGIKGADMLIAQWHDGAAHTDIVHLMGTCEAVVLSMDDAPANLPEQLGFVKDRYEPAKRSYLNSSDYITYSRDCAALERGRSIWKIKPDIGVDRIPTHILRQALLEGSMEKDGQFDEILSPLTAIYRRRYEDACTKHKHCYTIFKKGAFRRFVLSGRTSDHFWGMRPYTIGERIEILQALLDQQKNNPYAHIFFLKNDQTLRDAEISCYDGAGILILPSDTDYNLARGHSEVMVAHEGVMALYREFFREILLRDYVTNAQESVRYLSELLREAAGLQGEQ